jgi:ubiquitin-conjugating enzyme E2 variant
MHLLITVLSTALQIVLIAAVADFIAGVIHWAEDAYFTENTPFIGPLFIRPNIVHHHYPRFFTHLSWWHSSRDLVLVGALLLLAAWPLGLLCWQLGLFVALSINANEIHKWSHRTRKENGRLISLLQDWHILQTAQHHGLHHADPKNTYYCPITNFVNPVLERIAFWTRLEAVIARLTGVTHRVDTAVRGHGPGPVWLSEFRPTPAANVITFPSASTPTQTDADASRCNCATCLLRQGGTCARHARHAETERRAA